MLNASGGRGWSTYLKKPMIGSEGEAMPNCGNEQQESTSYGCIFCRVGCEDHVVTEILNEESDIRLISPVKLRYNRGKKATERILLFPGYVFFSVSPDYKISNITRNRYVYRVLTYADSSWQLVGADKEVAEKLFSCNGVIDFSKAYYENDRIRIVEGFLKDFEGKIKRVNHRMRTAEVVVNIGATTFHIWLGFELMASLNSSTNDVTLIYAR